MKMPDARAKAAEASFPTLVDAGNACFKIRRTHARGGSKSMADGACLLLLLPFLLSFGLLLLVLVAVVAVAVLAAPALALALALADRVVAGDSTTSFGLESLSVILFVYEQTREEHDRSLCRKKRRRSNTNHKGMTRTTLNCKRRDGQSDEDTNNERLPHFVGVDAMIWAG